MLICRVTGTAVATVKKEQLRSQEGPYQHGTLLHACAQLPRTRILEATQANAPQQFPRALTGPFDVRRA